MNVLPRKSVDVPTPPGTGYVANLSPAQKEKVKAIWKFMIAAAETGDAIIPVEMMYDLQNFALEGNGVQYASSKAAIEDGWFTEKKANKAIQLAQSEGFGADMAKVKLMDLGFNMDKIRASLWDSAGDNNPDIFILRFLRARKWNIINSAAKLLKALKWRVDEDVLDLKSKSDKELDNMFPDFIKQMELGKFYVQGTDSGDRPISYLNVRLHRPGDQTAKTVEKMVVYIMETGRTLLESPCETVSLVFDLTGFSLSNVDFALVRYLLQIFEAHYPECLGFIYIHGAPFFFWGVWKVIEPWLDPVVAAKIRFTKKDQDLLQYIPAEHLPDKFKGGLNKFRYEYIPEKPDKNARMKDTETKNRLVEEWKELMRRFEALTKEWATTGTEQAISPKSEEEVEKERIEISREIRTAYFKKDPYVRARNMFHRMDPPVSKEDGGVEWTYKN
ncbi:hypothetical protein EC968_004068 [Mortierella alpina]|nr:hypothetical protein EC968_004068 [Mortierella alpina]